jgi:hypothetical protein
LDRNRQPFRRFQTWRDICFESVIRSKAGIRQAFFGIGAGLSGRAGAPVDHAFVTFARNPGQEIRMRDGWPVAI